MKQPLFFILLLLALSNCTQPATHEETFTLELPQGNFTSEAPVKKGGRFEVMIRQVSENEFSVGYGGDTLVLIPDSTLHQKLFELLENDWGKAGFRFTAMLAVDKDLPVTVLETITAECRKTLITRFKLQLEGGTLLPLRTPPYDLTRAGFIDPDIRSLHPPRPAAADPDSIAGAETSVHVYVSPRRIQVTDPAGAPIADFEAYIREQKQFFTVFDFDPACTSQDYVDFYTYMFSAYQNVRTSMKGTGNTQTLRKEYPLRMVRK